MKPTTLAIQKDLLPKQQQEKDKSERMKEKKLHPVSRTALSNLVASGHMWLFKLKGIGPARNQGVTTGWCFLYRTTQIQNIASTAERSTGSCQSIDFSCIQSQDPVAQPAGSSSPSVSVSCPERSLDPKNRASQTDGDFFWRARVKGRGRANGAEADKSPSILQQMAPRDLSKSLAFRRGRRENGGWNTRISHTLIQKLKVVEKLSLCLQSNCPKG